jgi:hypothetical protein
VAWFMTRVELHDATWSDYTKLHEAMRTQGFGLSIVGDDGKSYALPPAEYWYDGAITRDDVFSKGKSAAGSVKSSYAVVVTEAVSSTWCGLTVA